jgi:hypothetical protein
MHFGLKLCDSRVSGTNTQTAVRRMCYSYGAVSVNAGDTASVLNTQLFRRTR